MIWNPEKLTIKQLNKEVWRTRARVRESNLGLKILKFIAPIGIVIVGINLYQGSMSESGVFFSFIIVLGVTTMKILERNRYREHLIEYEKELKKRTENP